MRSADTNSARPILVASNLEENSLLVHHAAMQARRTGARVVLAHVVAPKAAEKKTSPGIVRIADPALCRTVLDQLEFAAIQLLWQGIVCDPVVLSGDPAQQIVALAHARGADRVLVADRVCSVESSSGETTVQRLLRTLDLPLFVLGPHASSIPEADVADGRILLPLSLRHDRPEYVAFGSRLAREICSRLTLFHVIDTSHMTERQRQQVHTNAYTQLAALAATESNPLFPIEILVREGDVVQAIVEEAVCPHRDLIVLGTGPVHYGVATRNGVVRQVIANARCPVVALKPQHTADAKSSESTGALTSAAD